METDDSAREVGCVLHVSDHVYVYVIQSSLRTVFRKKQLCLLVKKKKSK